MLTTRVPAQLRSAPARPRLVLMGGYTPPRSPGAFGRREGLRSATTAEWQRTVGCAAPRGAARAADDALLELTARDGALWRALAAATLLAPEPCALLVHLPTLRPVALGGAGAPAGWHVLVADADRPLARRERARVVLVDALTRAAILERAGFCKAQRPLRRPSMRAEAPMAPPADTAAIVGVAVGSGAPRLRTDARAVLRYAAPAPTPRRRDDAPRPTPAAAPRFAEVRPVGEEAGRLRFSRRPVAHSGRIPHSINSRF
ncbi:hypothetical protein KFE25_011295 [Diacronema lutheri]|uniref:Uncharacterized protein n=1 Tax=Diacronema lutheri TaxID=2081491 RepID=A0A8J5X6Y3_DIALT|nr:hypothetical protein KFE25_011295 [Diacronema lutheri]